MKRDQDIEVLSGQLVAQNMMIQILLGQSVAKNADSGAELRASLAAGLAAIDRWYDRWSAGGFDGLENTAPHPGSVWNRLPEETRADIIEFALEHENLTPRELAVKYTDEKQYFVTGIIGLSDPEGGRPGHGTGAYRDEGGQ